MGYIYIKEELLSMKIQPHLCAIILFFIFFILQGCSVTNLRSETGEPDQEESDEQVPISLLHYYTFGHSLFKWDFGGEPGSMPESSTGYWLGYLADGVAVEIAGTGQFGQLSYHEIPPQAGWGFSTNEFDPWPDGSFADQDFTHVIIMPSNFEQYDTSAEDYMEDTMRVLDYVVAQEPNAEIILYEHYPEPNLSGAVTDGADLSDLEWSRYRDYTRGAYHDWFLAWQDLIVSEYPSVTVRMIPLGPIVMDLVEESFFSDVLYTDLYADDAPHGTRSSYLLMALICYRALIGENPDINGGFPEDQIILEIRENSDEILSFIESRLAYYNVNGVNVY